MTGADVYALRQRLGLTQTDFGARVGLTQPAIAMIESGQRGVTPMLEMLLRKMEEEKPP